MSNLLQCVILAGGLGKRMSSTKAKVLHKIKDKPMLFYVIQNAFSVGASRIFIVVGKYKQDIISEITPLFSTEQNKSIVYVDQPETKINGQLCSLGTGDAVRACLTYFEEYNLSPQTNILILSGDVPFISLPHLTSFSKLTNAIMVSSVDEPAGYGRVFFDESQNLSTIVEHAICTPQQLKCTTVNAGIYNLTVDTITQTIPLIEINPQKNEFFLTDFYKHTNTPIFCFFLPHVPQNVNTIQQLQDIS